MVKSLVKQSLMQLGVFDALRYSIAYEVFLHVFRPAQIRGRKAEVAFYREILGALPPDALIFDIGGNRGFKSEVFTRVASRVVCVEPDRSNVAILRRKFAAVRDRVSVVDAAVGATPATMMFNVIDPGSAFNTLSTKWVESLQQREGTQALADQYPVQVTTLDALIAQFGVPQFIKIDVEGFEIEVVRGLSRPVPLLSFELNLPEFRAEGAAIVARLVLLMPGVRFNYCTEPAPDAFSTKQALKHDTWLSPDAFLAFLDSTAAPYLEVYARDATVR